MKRKILFVDDDKDFVDSSLECLSQDHRLRDYEFDRAGDGNAVLEMYDRAVQAQDPYSLIVLDLMLPKRSGFLVVENIRTTKRDKTTPILMITGNPGKRHITYAYALGVNDYLQKPFFMEVLADHMSALLLPKNLGEGI